MTSGPHERATSICKGCRYRRHAFQTCVHAFRAGPTFKMAACYVAHDTWHSCSLLFCANSSTQNPAPKKKQSFRKSCQTKPQLLYLLLHPLLDPKDLCTISVLMVTRGRALVLGRASSAYMQRSWWQSCAYFLTLVLGPFIHAYTSPCRLKLAPKLHSSIPPWLDTLSNTPPDTRDWYKIDLPAVACITALAHEWTSGACTWFGQRTWWQ